MDKRFYIKRIVTHGGTTFTPYYGGLDERGATSSDISYKNVIELFKKESKERLFGGYLD